MVTEASLKSRVRLAESSLWKGNLLRSSIKAIFFFFSFVKVAIGVAESLTTPGSSLLVLLMSQVVRRVRLFVYAGVDFTASAYGL